MSDSDKAMTLILWEIEVIKSSIRQQIYANFERTFESSNFRTWKARAHNQSIDTPLSIKFT